MRFRTGFVVGCATGLYLTRKLHRLGAPLAGRSAVSAPAAHWLSQSSPSLLSGELRGEKVLALGDLARERARDVLRGQVGTLARDRVIALVEEAVAAQRARPAKRA
jgi:hypothetical protein